MGSGDNGSNREPFGFPFKPYDVQLDLMGALTRAIDTRAVGLFESPTGTGKTLSIICATMSWLIAHRADPVANGFSNGLEKQSALDCSNRLGMEEQEEPDWVLDHVTKKAEHGLAAINTNREHRFSARVENAKKTRNPAALARSGKKVLRLGSQCAMQTSSGNAEPGHNALKHSSRATDDHRYLLECNDNSTASSDDSLDSFMPSKRVTGIESRSSRVCETCSDMYPETENRLRVVFATRTHTQLAQFVREIHRTDFGAKALSSPLNLKSSLLPNTCGGSYRDPVLRLSVVTFGSRNVMCVNEQVRSLSTPGAVADRCHELLSTSTAKKSVGSAKRSRQNGSGSGGCPYKSDTAERILRDSAIVQVQDIEELVEAGRRIGGCPYFSARAAVESGEVDVIGVPYSAILHEPTRKALGLHIDDKTIVVFDEAHNIANAVNEIHSAVASSFDLVTVRGAIAVYVDKYQARLAARNLFLVRQLLAALNGLASVLEKAASEAAETQKTRVISSSQLIFEAGIENINMFMLSSFLQDSRLCQKLMGFVDAGYVSDDMSGPVCENQSTDLGGTSGIQRRARNSIATVERFILALNSSREYSRVIVHPKTPRTSKDSDFPQSGYLRYFVLRPGPLFSAAVSSARAVLLVGGTLSPRDALKDTVLSDMLARPVVEFECDHVIPASNLAAIVMPGGPSGRHFEFTHQTKTSDDLMDDLGQSLIDISGVSRGGVVIFFASYAYMSDVLERWKLIGITSSLTLRKPMFCESRGSSSAWSNYLDKVEEDPQRGAILTAVMGGRLSEGINFSDDLGRVVVVVGMPFPNSTEAETAEVLRSLKDNRERSEYLENACMTVVNQAIGRAIRHRSDYASIILCDRRFSRPHIVAKLPKFIRQSLTLANSFSDVQSCLVSFFDNRGIASVQLDACAD